MADVVTESEVQGQPRNAVANRATAGKGDCSASLLSFTKKSRDAAASSLDVQKHASVLFTAGGCCLQVQLERPWQAVLVDEMFPCIRHS